MAGKTLMKWQNWVIVVAGVLSTYIGFAMISRITTNYDGAYAFISVGVTVVGLLTVVLGLALGFEPRSEA